MTCEINGYIVSSGLVACVLDEMLRCLSGHFSVDYSHIDICNYIGMLPLPISKNKLNTRLSLYNI